MADLSKLKNKKNRFGDIPESSETKGNLEAPEHAPLKPKRQQKARQKTGRTEPFGTRVSPEFLRDFNQTAFTTELKKVELLEDMLREYRRNKGIT